MFTYEKDVIITDAFLGDHGFPGGSVLGVSTVLGAIYALLL